MVLQVTEAAEWGLNASKSERDGPGRRVSDALSRAAMEPMNTSSAKLLTPTD
jgi:hypothetical protein